MILRLRRSKKGGFFMIILLVFFLAALMYALIGSKDSFDRCEAGGVTKGLGQQAATVMMTYQSGDRLHTYLESASRYATEEAFYDLAQNGGIEGLCGKYNDFNLWNSPDLTCMNGMGALETNLEERFFSPFFRYTESYSRGAIPDTRNAYLVSIEAGDDIAVSLQSTAPARLPIALEDTIPTTDEEGYFLKVSTHTTNPLNFSVYKHIQDRIAPLQDCADADCVKDGLADLPDRYEWLVMHNGNLIKGGWDAWTSTCASAQETFYNAVATTLQTCASTPDSMCMCELEFPKPDRSAKLDIAQGSRELKLTGTSDEIMGNTRTIEDVNFLNIPASVDSTAYPNNKIAARKENGGLVSVLSEADRAVATEPACRPPVDYAQICVIDKNLGTIRLPEGNNVVEKVPVVKFSYYFPGEITDVQNVAVRNSPIEEDSVFVTWDALSSSRVKEYAVYINSPGGIDFIGEAIDDVKVHPEFSSLRQEHVSLSSALEYKDFPGFPDADTPLDYTACYSLTKLDDTTETRCFTTGELYYFKEPSGAPFYLYIVDVVDDEEMEIGVTGVDIADVESPHIMGVSTEDPGMERGVDDLSPGQVTLSAVTANGPNVEFAWNIPSNVDGSIADDITTYEIGCVSADTATISSIIPITTETTTTATVPLALIESTCGALPENQRFAVFAYDETDNTYTEAVSTTGVGSGTS